MTQRILPTLALWLLMISSHSALAAFNFDPFLTWKTLKTEHFHIHYHDGTEELAKKTALISERVHKRISAYLSWEPTEPTQVVISDRVDFSNGMATPIYQNQMFLYMTPPDEINTLEDYDDWLDLLITHEYTHIIHIDKVSRVAAVFRKIFGRTAAIPLVFTSFPGVFQPRLFTEGLATWTETDYEKGIGRGQSSSFEMMMRMESIDGIKPLRQILQPNVSWPAGTGAYLYGVYFWQYIAESRGEDKIPLWVYVYSGKVMPYMLNSTSYSSLGEDLDDVWAGFDAAMQEKFGAQIEAIKARGLRDGERLTNGGYYTMHPRIAHNGDIWYVQNDFADDSWLMVLREGSEQPEKMTRVHGERFDLHPEAGILLTQLEIVSNTEYYSDVYRIDPVSGASTRLTHGGRYRSATWGTDGNSIVAVHNQAGNAALHLLDASGKLQELLWQGRNMEVIGEPDLSPDGRTLVAPLWRADSRWDLELFSLDNRSWTKLTRSDDVETNPRFSADGKSVIFSADYGGVYNTHIVDLQDPGHSRALTNVIGGAFHPDLDRERRTLVYTGFTEQGYDIFRISGDALQETPSMQAKPKTVTSAPDWYQDPLPEFTISDYSPWGSLLPRGWSPVLYGSDHRIVAGAIIAGADPLLRHSWALAPMWDFRSRVLEGYFYYDYDRWNPSLRLAADRSAEEHTYNNAADKERLQRLVINEYAALELLSPILDLDYQWGLHLGAVYNREREKRIAEGFVRNPALKDTLAGAAISFNSSRYYPKAISPANGRSVKLIAEDSDFMDGDYQGRAHIADWQEFISLGARHVLALRLAAARGDRGIRPFSLGGSFPEAMGHPLNLATGTIFNKRDFALRGYKGNLPELTGRNLDLAMLEWRFPLWLIERGVTAPPIGIHNLHGRLFYNAGEAWDRAADRESRRRGMGLEFHTELVLGYMLPVNLYLGAARGIDDQGESIYYLGIGSSF